MLSGLLGKKLGMAQYIHEDGTVSAVTALEVGPCAVTQVKTAATDGYDAIQVGFAPTKAKHLTRPQRGHLTKAELPLYRRLREVRALSDETPQVGQVVTVDQLFEAGELVRVTGVSKGKGFAGVVKRWHFGGGPKSHGQKDRWRAPGSIGAGTTPGRVFKGLKMAGQMGAHQVTQRNIRVVAVDAERNVLFLNGSVPGARNGLVTVWKQQRG